MALDHSFAFYIFNQLIELKIIHFKKIHELKSNCPNNCEEQIKKYRTCTYRPCCQCLQVKILLICCHLVTISGTALYKYTHKTSSAFQGGISREMVEREMTNKSFGHQLKPIHTALQHIKGEIWSRAEIFTCYLRNPDLQILHICKSPWNLDLL